MPKALDLGRIRGLTGAALTLLRHLDGIEPPAGNNAESAELRRDLNYLADVLDRAASETRAVYHHQFHDRPDPLEGM